MPLLATRLDSRALAVGLFIGAGAGAAIYALLQRRPWRRRRVYVSGCFDLLHSGHGVHSDSNACCSPLASLGPCVLTPGSVLSRLLQGGRAVR